MPHVERSDYLKLVSFGELVARPPAPWRVRGVLREQSMAMIYGRRGCYKSFLALDLAACIALGRPWHGHAVETAGLVIYVAAEGGGGMVQRARAWAEQAGVDPNMVNILFVTEPVVVTSDDSQSEGMDVLIDRIQDAIEYAPGDSPEYCDPEDGQPFEHPTAREWPALIVIDTLARCFLGNENGTEDMGRFVQGVDRLRHEFDCSILIVHHTGRDETRERGNTALPGACDTIFKLEADADEHSLEFTCEKMKDGREPMPTTFSFREVAVKRRASDDPNEELTSVIIEAGKSSPEQKTAKMLEILIVKGSLTYAEWAEQAGFIGVRSGPFKRGLHLLKRTRKIINKNGQYEAF